MPYRRDGHYADLAEYPSRFIAIRPAQELVLRQFVCFEWFQLRVDELVS